MGKTAVLLSGGVDSAVALALLKKAGQEVHAFYIKVWLQEEMSFLGECPWEQDVKKAQAVCRFLGVPFQVISLQTEYWEKVIEASLQQIQLGKTPNPDMLCNSLIKFKAFQDVLNKGKAETADAEYQHTASGHYARLEQRESEILLKTASDPIKDQTYFLAQLSAEQLRQCVFPIGHLVKAEVRALASIMNLPNAQSPESQGLCFLGKMNFRHFIAFHLGERRGKIIEQSSGDILGGHKGHWFYTIGQRQGLGLSSGPWYVKAKNVEENLVFVSRRGEETKPYEKHISLAKPHWISKTAPRLKEFMRVKLRYSPESLKCRLHSKAKPDSKHEYFVELCESNENADLGAAPGQYAVFYDHDVCCGSALIL